MAYIPHLLILSLVFLTKTSTQNIRSPKTYNKSIRNPQSSMDLYYLDACTAILKGLRSVNSNDNDLWYSFAEWENTNPDVKFLDYFENNKGIISKMYINDYYDDTWTLNLVLHDGDNVDKKLAGIQIYIENVQNDTTLNQTNGTFTTTNASMTFTVYYGEDFDTKSQTDIMGQVSIYFVNTDTNQPFSRFGKDNSNVKPYSFQLSFTSSDDSFSFSTSLFTSSYMTSSENLMATAFMIVSIIVSFGSWYSDNLRRKVTAGSLQAFYASASYIALWVFVQHGYYGLFYFLLLIPALLNGFKLFVFSCLKGEDVSDKICAGIQFGIFAAALNFVPTIWINLFPSFVLLLPFLQKLWNIKHNPYYLTRFEIWNFFYVLLWMAYAYLYPGNFYRISPNMDLIKWSFGCILFQFSVLLILEIFGRRREKKHLLLGDESVKDQATTSDPDAKDQQTKKSESVKTIP